MSGMYESRRPSSSTPAEQAALGERLDGERRTGSVGQPKRLLLEVHGDDERRVQRRRTQELPVKLGPDLDGEHAVLQSVRAEDVREGVSDDAAEPGRRERPYARARAKTRSRSCALR